MRKLLYLLTVLFAAVCMTTVLTGCGDDGDDQEPAPQPPTPVDTTTTQKPDPTPDPTPEPTTDATRYVGGDLSMLTKYEEQQAQYADKDGQRIGNVISFLQQQGWNTLRIRLFVDPSQDKDKAVVQNLAYVKALGKRIKEAGMFFLLDFHYSDTWADPGKQWTPAGWLSLTDAQLNTQIYEYTRDCLKELVAAGATPDLIQTGNEISYGMLWGKEGTNANRCYTNSPAANWTRFTNLLKQAGKACREVCPQAKIILHSERTPNPGVLTDFFDRMKAAYVDYDIIGLSYYSYFHGKLPVLETALKQLEAKNYGKAIQIVETGYPSKWAVPGTETDYTGTYPYSAEGQRKFTADLIDLLKNHEQVNGLSWWYAEANAKGTTGDLSTGWYNAGLFDNETGRALPALYELQSFK
jgi:arabinogalactan endo-1,4-beta-galactosidase